MAAVERITVSHPSSSPNKFQVSLTLRCPLTGTHDVTLLALGGQYHSWCNAFMGRMTINEIKALRADIAFISMSAISDGVVLHQSPETINTKRAMFDCSVKRILLADHTKFERRALHSFAILDEFDAIIVDDKLAAGACRPDAGAEYQCSRCKECGNPIVNGLPVSLMPALHALFADHQFNRKPA